MLNGRHERFHIRKASSAHVAGNLLRRGRALRVKVCVECAGRQGIGREEIALYMNTKR